MQQKAENNVSKMTQSVSGEKVTQILITQKNFLFLSILKLPVKDAFSNEEEIKDM